MVDTLLSLPSIKILDKIYIEELKIFENEEFGQVRTIVINNEPWFVGKDVAEALGYANPKNAVPKHVLDEDKLST